MWKLDMYIVLCCYFITMKKVDSYDGAGREGRLEYVSQYGFSSDAADEDVSKRDVAQISSFDRATDLDLDDVWVTVLGLFDLTCDRGGYCSDLSSSSPQQCTPRDGSNEVIAANLAIKHINQQQILPMPYKLTMITNDTKVSPVP